MPGLTPVGSARQQIDAQLALRVGRPGERPCLDVLQHAKHYRQNANDPEKAEYFVKVEWLDTVPLKQAVNEVGLFGNQNTVCQPTTPKWRHTVERLKTHFPKWNSHA